MALYTEVLNPFTHLEFYLNLACTSLNLKELGYSKWPSIKKYLFRTPEFRMKSIVLVPFIGLYLLYHYFY